MSIILISPYGSNDLPHSHRSFVCTSIQGRFVFALMKCSYAAFGEQNKIDNDYKYQQVYKTSKKIDALLAYVNYFLYFCTFKQKSRR